MAIHEIVLAIDAYIDRLKAARELLASLHTTLEVIDRKPRKRKSRGKPQSIQLADPPPRAPQVAVQIIPTRAPRQQRRLERPVAQAFYALGRPVPKGPVVIRSSDLARMRSGRSQAHPTTPAQQPTASRGALEELAQEVAKRLAISVAKADTSAR
jgi:hypothetical protein